MEGIKKNIRYWSWISGKNMLMLIGFAVFFGILFGMLDGGVPEVLSVTSFYLLLFGVMCGGAMQVAAIYGSVYCNGSKAKGCFLRYAVYKLDSGNRYISFCPDMSVCDRDDRNE